MLFVLQSTWQGEGRKGHTRFTSSQRTLLADLDSGRLRIAANDAVKAFGHGRLKMADGSFNDLGQHCGGMTRTILDDWVPIVVPPSDDEGVVPNPTVSDVSQLAVC